MNIVFFVYKKQKSEILIEKESEKMFKKIKQILYRSLNLNNKDISYKTAMEILKNNDGVLIDVRTGQEYKEGHLPNAININLYNLEKEILYKIPNKETVIVVYCASGARSKQAQNILENLGYKTVYNLKNGISQ